MKLFSVEEANALLPSLRKLLRRLAQEQRVLADLEASVGLAREKAEYGGGAEGAGRYVARLMRMGQLIREVQALGVVIKDLDVGLCDFPHDRNGRVVFLCWKRDEDRVEWWHEVDAGFAGRQPLD
jgi:hypothetical protein